MTTAIKVTIISLILNTLLIVIKFFTGIVGKSSAMVADAVHSLSDAFTDLIIIFGIRYAEKPADKCHQYGHGKAESFITIVVAIILIFTGGGIGYSAIIKGIKIFNGEIFDIPSQIALIAAAVSILIKELLFRYSYYHGKKLSSSSLIANAWHHRTDALSSIAAFIGIGGSILLGDQWIILDPFAAFFTAILIIKAAIPLLKNSSDELMEKSLGNDIEQKIITSINNIPGTYHPHNIRTRKIGRKIAMDIHIYVKPTLSIVKAHDIATNVELSLENVFGKETIINVHVEPKKPYLK